MYLCITNRHLCRESLPQRLKRLSRQPEIKKIILREKDLSENEYEILARKCMEICGEKLVLHTFTEVAERLGVNQIHLSLEGLRQYHEKAAFRESSQKSAKDVKDRWQRNGQARLIGVSVHSVEEAIEAEHLGAACLIAGHIFATDCKKGLPPKGCQFLREICQSVKIPVYGIGGITPQNIHLILETGAAGGCRMSGFML